MRSEKYRQQQNKTTVKPKSDDHWEETQVLFRSRDEFKEEIKQQNAYEERRARAAAYKEYLALRENKDGNSAPETDRKQRSARRSQKNTGFEEDNRTYSYTDEKIRKKKPILSEDKDRDDIREEKRQLKRRSRQSSSGDTVKEKIARSGRKSGFGGGKRSKLFTVLLVAAVLLVGSLLLFVGTLGKVGKLDIDKNNIGIDAKVADDLKKYRNIALLGVDARDMDNYDSSRTDAIIIISIDKKENEIRQISVYRDTYLHVNDEYGYDKVTNIHAYAGTEGTLHALNENMDLNIDEVVIVNWKAVASAIDALGGIEIEVLDSEVNELNKYIPETARSIGEEATKVESAGKQTLNGVQAVTYSRIRKDAATGDYRRNERMKIVVTATVEKALKNPWKITKAASASLPQIKTNMGVGGMMSAAMAIVTKDMTDNAGWPFNTSGWTAYNGAWCGVPVTLNSNVIELHEEYFAQPDYSPTDTVQSISSTISARTGYY